MAAIQLGWALSGRSWGTTTRDMFLHNVDEGFKLIDGHFDSVWLTDHLQYDAGPVLEGWTTLTYFVGLYPHLNFGHTVLSQSFRNPALLAKMGATLHYLSRERFILGIGTGWKKDEYLAYGYDFPPPKVRIEQLEEVLQIVKALWWEDQVTFHGKYYHVDNAYCEPKPVPQPVIMVGGCKPRMLRLIARHADWWNVSWYSLSKTRPDNWSNGSLTGIGEYREQVQESERACQEVGRDAAALRRTWFGPCICAPSEAEVQKLHAQNVRTDHGFAGTPEQVLVQMQPFIELGVDYFMFTCPDFPDLTTLILLTNEVLPVLNQKNQASRP
jgi:alkanesulfonate monooxygenase SsuD/methylene tetrahydromethanopterin reductase-like flavin-dependent oxidoreductase (luciferase family)